MKHTVWMGPLLALCFVTGCQTVYNADRVPTEELAMEGTVVFARPDKYSILGTRSLRDYTEIVYEDARLNEAGLLVVELGIRNRGGQHFWDVAGPTFNMSAKTVFFREDITGGNRSAPVYETNWETLRLSRGETVNYKAICLNSKARGYQITLSEMK